MKEYYVENNEEVNLKNLESQNMPKEDYEKVHQSLPILCHDVFIEYNGGILLVMRRNLPAKDILWPIGGRAKRGILAENSLKLKVKEECNLELEDIKYLDAGRTMFTTDPFGHGKGTDTLNLAFVAKGKGELKLDNLHDEPTIVKKETYTEEFRETLHPYVRDFLDIIIPQLK